MSPDPALASKIDFTGQRILLVCPRFFSYEERIAADLRSRGAQVDLLPDRPFASPVFHLVARVWRRAVLPVTNRHYRRLLKGFGDRRYDHVFVVNGQTLSMQLLKDLRRANPAARFTLYLWDALANRRGALELLSHFDRVFSFEPSACERYGLTFRPLFFDPAYAAGHAGANEFAISFIGTAHTDRYPTVRMLDSRLLAGQPRFWYLYLKARWVFLAMRLSRRSHRDAREDEFRFEPLPHMESARIFWQSRAILDIEHPRQEGLTMRTFEALGAGKKLVTTNRNITRYRFYDPARVCIVDRRDPRIPEEFLGSDAPPVPEEFHAAYSLAGWVDEIFGEPTGAPIHLREGQP